VSRARALVFHRPKLGKIAAKYADFVIVTNEDPYDENPQLIIDQVAEGAILQGKSEENNLFKILDRGEAIKKAIDMAGENDVVIITGKGSEQCIVTKGGKKIDWDDRAAVRKYLKNKEKDYSNRYSQ
jgi:UDP-N-acetylmuramoyl-L-alanyl-D-glutamate--2,6-diaminopimelate ligase